ncbi:MarR family winged helix-turn-helix transcriptional regulator [Streptomyces sp. NPDC092296]|uniref:MarR family winged helix-turn-helix transcriptional regulator n=1 Tax=Streptomyces sp. NPDC092296 TaxID=3366012 RepID=UPI00381EDB7F
MAPTDPTAPTGPDAPDSPGDPGDPGDTAELSDALVRAVKRIRRQTALRLEPYGITPGQGRALRVLAHAADCETPGRAMRLSELADRLHIAPRSATTVVDALEASGLVLRVPDPADRRAVGLELTGPGRQAVQRMGQVRQEVAEEYFGGVSAADREVLLRVLRDAESAHAIRYGHSDRRRRPPGGRV